MQYQHIGHKIKGFYRIASYAIKPGMNKTAQQRLKTLEFWDKHGLSAAIDSSGKSRRTLFLWKKAYRQFGISGLVPKSTAPKIRRRRQWPIPVINQIKTLRKKIPNLGKDQVYVLLKPWCEQRSINCPCPSTIGRLIADDVDKMRVSPPQLTPKGQRKIYKRPKVKRRSKGYKPKHTGECVGMDAIERRLGTLRRYILTYIDEVSDYAVALAVPKLNANIAKQFFQMGFKLSPFQVKQVITDSGSEFKGAFDQQLKDNHITHLWTYPNTPKMNAVCERFNRTLQEQFVDFNEQLLFEDLDLFNQKMADYLVIYNSVRPHKSLGLKTPVQFIINNKPKCNRYWTHTIIIL